MLPSTQLCSAVPASEDVSVGTHTRLTSGLKACISMQLFMPFKCCKSKRHTGRVGNGQTSCHSDENVALCVVEQLGWRGRRTQAAHPGGPKPQWTSKGTFPGSGQAGELMIPQLYQHLFLRYQHYCSCFLLFFLLYLPSTSIHSLSVRYVTDEQIYCIFKRRQGPWLALAPSSVLCLPITFFCSLH